MKNEKQKKGFILLLVVGIIPLVGMVMAVIMTNCHMLALQIRREELRLHAENACQSGLAWIEKNPGNAISLVSEQPVFLSIKDGTPQINCRVEIVRGTTSEQTLRIIGHAEDSRFSVESEQLVTP